MGAYLYFFCTKAHVPTIQELIDRAAEKGFVLKPAAEMFDDDDEEEEFLNTSLHTRTWNDVVLADEQERLVIEIGVIRATGLHWKEEIAHFIGEAMRAPESHVRAQVIEHLTKTQVEFQCLQTIARDRAVWPAQEAVLSLLTERLDAIFFADTLGEFIKQDKVILKAY